MMSGTLAANPYTVSFPKWPYSPRWTPWSDVNTIRVSSYMPWDLEEECTYLQCVFSSDVNTITVRRVYVVLHALGSMNERGHERNYNAVVYVLISTNEENIPSISTYNPSSKNSVILYGKTYYHCILNLWYTIIARSTVHKEWDQVCSWKIASFPRQKN